MINANDIPYGALYAFQPDYLGRLIHDEIYHQDKYDEMEVPEPIAWEVFVTSVKAFFTES